MLTRVTSGPWDYRWFYFLLPAFLYFPNFYNGYIHHLLMKEGFQITFSTITWWEWKRHMLGHSRAKRRNETICKQFDLLITYTGCTGKLMEGGTPCQALNKYVLVMGIWVVFCFSNFFFLFSKSFYKTNVLLESSIIKRMN